MQKKSSFLWAQVLARWFLTVLSVLGLMAASLPASAQSALPTSALPAKGSWDHMIPSSFRGSLSSAFGQCQRDEAISPTDPLTPDKCDSFKAKLALGECRVVSVPDGIVFDILNGRWGGKSGFKFGMRKHTGREDRALLCDLGDGVWGYWFTGIHGQSCNNVAFVFVPKPVATPAPPPPQPPPVRVYFGQVNSDTLAYQPAVVLPHCDCCGNTGVLYAPGFVIPAGPGVQSQGYYVP